MTSSRIIKWGDLATLEYGKSLRDYRESKGKCRVFGTNGPIGWSDESLCSTPTVIVGRKGAYRGIHFSFEPCFVIDTAFYLKPKVDFDMRWAYYQLLTQDINGMDSGSAIPSTSRDDFYQLSVNVPPLEQQKKVARILSDLDAKIELNNKMNKTLETMAQALFKKWFVDFEFPGYEKVKFISGLPDGWREDELTNICDILMGQSPPGETYNESGDGVVFYQGNRDFGFRFPTPRVYCTAPTRIAEDGDILISVRAPVGALNIALERCAIGRGVAALRMKRYSNGFLYYFCLFEVLNG